MGQVREKLWSGKKTQKAEAEKLCAFIIVPMTLQQKEQLFQVM